MPGAWELEDKPKLAICTPIQSPLVTIDWALQFRRLYIPFKHNFLLNKGYPIDIARNHLVKEALKQGVDYILFWDSDVIPERIDALKLLMDHDYPIVSGAYFSKKGHLCAWLYDEEKNKLNPVKFEKDAVMEVDAVGAGFCLIKAEVFKKIPEPWFEWTLYEEKGRSEDINFCLKAKEYGFGILLDCRVRCLHACAGFITNEGKIINVY